VKHGYTAAFRELRRSKGKTQPKLALEAGCHPETISLIEREKINPKPRLRSAIAAALGEPVDVVFASFPAPLAEQRRARRAELAQAYANGSSIAVAEEAECAASTVTRAVQALGGEPRPNLRTVQSGGWISTTEFKRRHPKLVFSAQALREAIDDGRVPGKKVVGTGLGRHGYIYLVHEAKLLDALADLPPCRYDGCDSLALGRFGCCSGAHARAVELQGRRLGRNRKISEAKKGKPRPDQRERLREVWADPLKRYGFQLASLEARRRNGVKPTTIRNAKNRVNGFKEPSEGARPRGNPPVDPTKRAEIIRAYCDSVDSNGAASSRTCRALARQVGVASKTTVATVIRAYLEEVSAKAL
jgi:DNA-binding XRE family transcriptional regulator